MPYNFVFLKIFKRLNICKKIIKCEKMVKKKVPVLIVKSAVREVAGKVRISDSFFEALNKEVERIIKRAVERAKGNGRSTLRDVDV